MQKIQLHIFLLILLVMGCGSHRLSPDNPYFNVNEKLLLDITSEFPPLFRLFGTEISIRGESQPWFQVQSDRITGQPWQLQWEWAGEPLEMSPRSVSRTLTVLDMTDSLTQAKQSISVLPGGQGVIVRLEGRSQDEIGFVIRIPVSSTDDRVLTETPRVVGKRMWIFPRKDGSFAAVAVSGKEVSVQSAAASAREAVWRFSLASAKIRQVVIAVGKDESTARGLAEKYIKLSPPKIHAEILAILRARAAFSLNTEDDRSNQLHALLTAALSNAESQPDASGRLAVEEYSQCVVGEWLASRARPATVFPPNPTAVTRQQKQDYLRWGSQAYRAAFAYGMAGDDTLRQLSLDALAEISKLQSDYVTADLEALGDRSITDSLMRLAVAHVRMAGVMNLGEDISQTRGDANAQGIFRGEAIRASRRAMKLFNSSGDISHKSKQTPRRGLTDFFDDEDSTIVDATHLPAAVSGAPDTALYLSMGAKYGFGFLADNPSPLWKSRPDVDGFVWQRWTDQQFRMNPKVMETSDFDSLTALLLDNPLPGLLVSGPPFEKTVSLSAMAAALQNLSELYVGAKPNVPLHRVDIEPRPPSRWGHTAARVPYGLGSIDVEYQFDRDFAVVGMSGIETDVDVYFGYPLRTGGFLRTQFTLSPGKHPQRIDLKRESEGRVRLETYEVP